MPEAGSLQAFQATLRQRLVKLRHFFIAVAPDERDRGFVSAREGRAIARQPRPLADNPFVDVIKGGEFKAPLLANLVDQRANVAVCHPPDVALTCLPAHVGLNHRAILSYEG